MLNWQCYPLSLCALSLSVWKLLGQAYSPIVHSHTREAIQKLPGKVMQTKSCVLISSLPLSSLFSSVLPLSILSLLSLSHSLSPSSSLTNTTQPCPLLCFWTVLKTKTCFSLNSLGDFLSFFFTARLHFFKSHLLSLFHYQIILESTINTSFLLWNWNHLWKLWIPFCHKS